MPQINTLLIVHIIGRHILQANLVIDAVAWPANGCHNIGSWPNRIGYLWANLYNLTEVFVADDKEVRAPGAFPYSAALISLFVPSTPTRNTFTRTPRPPAMSVTFGMGISSKCIEFGLPG